MTATAGREETLTIHGRQVAFRDYPGGGVPLLLLHGVGSTADSWEPAAAELAQSGTRVIVLDLPGHGRSSKESGDYSLGALASTLRDLMDQLDVPRAILVGHSLGGGIALQFSYQFPHRCAGLVLVASGGLGTETNLALRAATLPGAGVVMRVAINDSTVRWAAGVGQQLNRVGARPQILSEAAVARMSRLSEPGQRNSFLATLRAVVDFSGQRVSALEKLHVSGDRPVLIVWGERDPIIPMAHGSQAHDLLANSELVVFAGAGHEPHRHDPSRFAALVADWSVRAAA